MKDDKHAATKKLDAAAIAAIAELEKEAAALRFTIARHEDFEKYSEVTLTALRAAIKEAAEADDFDACAVFEARISELPAILDELKDRATAEELKAAGLPVEYLRAKAKWLASELKEVGFSVSELKEVGFSAGELKAAGFSSSELKAGGFSLSELKAGGFPREDWMGAQERAKLDKELWDECYHYLKGNWGKVKGMLDRGADPNGYKVRRT